MADFAYTVGVDIDSSGIDAFISKVRGLASSVNFGSSFTVPAGVQASGPGIAGGVANLNPAQGVEFARAVQASALAQLQTQRQQGVITPGEFAAAKTQVQGITNALLEGAKRFQSILGATAATTKSGLIVPESVLRAQEEDAARKAKVVVAQGLSKVDSDAAKAVENEQQREAALTREAREIKEKELQALRKRLLLTGQQTDLDRQIARTKGEILLAEQRQARLEREQAQVIFQQAKDQGFFNVGTRTQRLQAALHSRDGNLVDPLGERRLGQLIGNRVLQASSFAVGGLAFYGALQIIRDTLQETEKLEREFFVVRGQIDRTFGAESEQIFNRFKERVRDISQTTGQLGSDVAFVARQLSAAFVDPDAAAPVQRQQFELATANAEQAFKFAEVTNLDPKEITDSLTALGLSFPELKGDFRAVLDDAIALEEEFGVLGGQIITFAADLAPLAAGLGFTAEQLTELGATAQKFSGRSGGQLAEQFGRILTDLPTKAPDLISLFSGTPQLADLSKGLADAFVSDNMEQVLEFILLAANRVKEQNLAPGLVQQISETVAGRREGASFAAILRQPGELLEALRSDNDRSAGAVDRRWSEVRDSLIETMERLKRAVEQFAEAILSAGLADAFKFIAGGLTILAKAAGEVVRFFDRLNDVTGGVAGKMLGLYAIVKSVDAAFRAMSTSRVLGLLLPGRGGGGARTGVIGSIAEQGILGYAFGAARGAPAAVRTAASGGLSGLLGRFGGYAAGGLLAARGASVGGALFNFPNAIGGTAAGVAGPAAALIALNQLRITISNTRDAVKGYGDAFRLQAQSVDFRDLLRGFTAEDVDTRVSFLNLAKIPGTQSIGRRVLGGDLPKDILAQVGAERAGAAGLSAGLGAIDIESDLTEAGRARYGQAFLEVEKALAGEDANLEIVVAFLGEVAKGNSEVGDAIGAAVDAAIEVEVAAKEVTEGSSGPKFQQLLTALQGGRATPESVRNALQVAIEPLQVLAEAAIEAGDYTTYLTQMEAIAQLREAADKGISQYISNTVNFAEDIRDLFGDSTPETRIDAATRILADPNVTDDETRLKALSDLQAARNEAFELRLKAARNERERLDILAEGPGVDPIAQAEAIYQQIQRQIEAKLAELREKDAKGKAFRSSGGIGPVQDYGDEISAMEGVTREDIAAINDQLVEDIEEYGEGAIRIRLALLRARQRELQKAIEVGSLLGSGTQALVDELRSVESQIATYEGIEASGVDPSAIVTDSGELSEEEELDRQRRERAYARDRKLAEINRQRAAAGGDPVTEAALAVKAAEVSLAYAKEEFGEDSIEAINAEAELISARRQAGSAAKQLALAQLAVAQAYAAGDPVAEAALSIRAAQIAIQYAQGPIEALEAQAQLVAAYRQQQEAFDDIARAQLELAAASTQDPVEQAKIGLQQADLAVAQARGTAERIRAEAQRVEAARSLAEAIKDITDAQLELAIAIAEAGGDAVEASRKRLEQAQNALNDAISKQDQAAITRARADVVSATRAYNDSILDKKKSDIDFALEMGRITTGQAIESYRLLLQIPTLTLEQQRDIQLMIKRLQEEARQDYQFNLPTDIALPTLYEARRLNQSPNGYQDNRVITINLNASSDADVSSAVQTIVEELNSAQRFGTRTRLY